MDELHSQVSTEEQTAEQIDRTIARGDLTVVEQPKAKYVPSYKVVGNSKIPVSKAAGPLWKSRRDQALTVRQRRNHDVAWNEAIRYYRNDQLNHRTETDDADYAGNEGVSMTPSRGFTETENIVFANVSALVPMLYAKNPKIEVTSHDPDDEEVAQLIEDVVDRIFSKRSTPGIHLKPKVRKAVVMTTLCNSAYVEVGYTFREESAENAMEDIAKLSVKLEKAKTSTEIRKIEGDIIALEQHLDVLRPAGPFAKFRRPHDVLFDPNGVEDNHSDCAWMMVREYISTAYLNARFAIEKGGQHKSIYKPTHVLIREENADQGVADIETQTLIDYNEDDASNYNYDDTHAYEKAQRTECFYVWDRVTRRVLMYAADDWTYPIWVWDDPYQLQEFFPIYKLQFNTDPEDVTGKGEITYYLDQQDAINTMNSEKKRARQQARHNIFFNSSYISTREAESVLKGDEGVAVGINLPEGMKITDVVSSVVPPSMQYSELFDKAPIMEAIDRVSSVMPVQRGVEFKTNTTNQAVNQYNSVAQTRADEKIDAVEDFIGSIGWGITQISLQHMSQETVATLVGEKAAAKWRQLDANEIARKVSISVVGGSTQKQTTEAKKQQALQMGQILGQFVNAAPIPVMSTLIKLMRNAFGDVIPADEWNTIMEAVMQQGQQPQGPEGQQPSEGTNPQPPVESSPQGPDMAQIITMIDSLPPEAKEALGQAMAQGVPIAEALPRIIEAVQGPQQGPQQ